MVKKIFKISVVLSVVFLFASCRRANYDTIIQAVNKGDAITVKKYITDGGNVNYRDKKKQFTLLMHAALEGNSRIVKILLDAGANKNIKIAKNNATALHLSLISSNYKTIKLLLDETNVNSRVGDGNTPLILAAKRDDYSIVKLILENGGNMNSVSNSNHTVLISLSTSFHPNIDILKLLIAEKVKINIQEKYSKRTALIYYVLSGKVEAVKILLENKANPNLLDAKQLTALDYALQKENEKNIVDRSLHIVPIKMKDKLKIIKLLKNHGAKTAIELGVTKSISPAIIHDSVNKNSKFNKSKKRSSKSLYVSPL